MRVSKHKVTILKAALYHSKAVTATDFQISNANQYLDVLEYDGFMKLVYIDPETNQKYRAIADEAKAAAYIAAFDRQVKPKP